MDKRIGTRRQAINQNCTVPISQKTPATARGRVPLFRRILNNVICLWGESSATEENEVAGPNGIVDAPPKEIEGVIKREMEGVNKKNHPPHNSPSKVQEEDVLKKLAYSERKYRNLWPTYSSIASDYKSRWAMHYRESRKETLRLKAWPRFQPDPQDETIWGLEFLEEKRRRAYLIFKDPNNLHKKKSIEDSYLDISGSNILWDR